MLLASWWCFLSGIIGAHASTISRGHNHGLKDHRLEYPSSGKAQDSFLYRYEDVDDSYGEHDVVPEEDYGGYESPNRDWSSHHHTNQKFPSAGYGSSSLDWDHGYSSDNSNSPLNGHHSHKKSQTVDHGFFEGEESPHRSIRKYSDSDKLRVEESLLGNDGTMSYEVLRNCPHGRHLLLITLLEGFDEECWRPRCNGHIHYYLPDALKSPSQPRIPPNAGSLKDIVFNGNTLARDDVLNIYRRTAAANLERGKSYSRFRPGDVAAVNSLAKLALKFESFDSLLSFLVLLREICNREVFIEVLFLVIQVRSDVGFVVPNLASIRPETFFPAIETDNGINLRRGRMEDNLYEDPTEGRNPVRTFSFKTTHRSLPRSNPESELWHIREDVMANSMHGMWHVLVSDPNAPWVMTRRGELFYHMHKQMICRYNADRLAVGMDVVKPYDVNDWSIPSMEGFNSNLGSSIASGVALFSPRPPNRRLTDRAISQLKFGVSVVNQALRTMSVNGTRLYYANGIDHGVSKFGDLVEPYPDLLLPDAASLLHNYGHVEISELSERANSEDFGGVMGFADLAMRDPIFWKWHKFTDNFFVAYKERLGPYDSYDLSYAGVEVVSITATSGGRRNQLRTFTDFNTMELNANLMRTMNGTIMRYERLNHDPYVFTIRINAQVEEWAVGRIFLIPSNKIRDRDMLDVAVEMDKFNFKLTRGMNVITRRSSDSSLMTTGAPSLKNLQESLMRGMTETEFNWGNCGWPIELALPRGNAHGQEFELFVMISKVHPDDQHKIVSWERMYQTSWSWCGMKQGEGSFPDKRPMGFPLDRPFPLGTIMANHSNMKTTRVRIYHSG